MIRVEHRGPGVAVVRVDGRFVGRVLTVGTAWQGWLRPEHDGPLSFVGWGRRRRDVVALVLAALQ